MVRCGSLTAVAKITQQLWPKQLNVVLFDPFNIFDDSVILSMMHVAPHHTTCKVWMVKMKHDVIFDPLYLMKSCFYDCAHPSHTTSYQWCVCMCTYVCVCACGIYVFLYVVGMWRNCGECGTNVVGEFWIVLGWNSRMQRPCANCAWPGGLVVWRLKRWRLHQNTCSQHRTHQK